MTQYGFIEHLSADFPSQFVIDVSEVCNYACIHCPHPEFKKSHHYDDRMLDVALHHKLIDEVVTHGRGPDGQQRTRYIRYTSQGEPLAHPKFFEMMEYASSKLAHLDVPINLPTNGSLRAGERARRLVDAVEARLWTPLGLRSLAPGEPGYAARYEGGPRERDAVYHQGTVWPWLIGPFVEAWVRVRGGSEAAKRAARERFVAPLLRHLDEHGIGHVAEIADAEAPHTPRGCPFQAWSVGELLRLDRDVLAAKPAAAPARRRGEPCGSGAGS